MNRTRALILAGTAVLLLFGLRVAAGGDDSTATLQEQIQEKQRHFMLVVEELSTRDVSHLTTEQRAARAEALEELARYSERGRFTENILFPRRDVPYFIDHQGTRCALAHLIDSSGEPELVSDLAAVNNNAYISQIAADDRLDAWLDYHGFTREEIAFIQAPGTILPRRPRPTIPVRDDPRPDSLRPIRAPQVTGPPPSPGDSTPGPSRGTTTGRGRKAAAAKLDWETWWMLNRDAYTNLRTAFHDRGDRNTPRPDGSSADEATTRPSSATMSDELLPMFERIAQGDAAFASTGLMALARTGDSKLAPVFAEKVLAYVARPDARYQEFAILALGVLPHENSVAPLCEILGDSAKGRKILRQASSITERTRSFAAIALGRIGGAVARDTLLRTLDREAKNDIDIASACVMALGLVGQDEALSAPIVDYLAGALEKGKWNARILAHVPLALAHFDDARARAQIATIVKRFRGPRELRQSSAIALGLLGGGLDESLIQSLMVAAHRDPDAAARQYAIMALGDLAHSEGEPTYESYRKDSKMLERMTTFYEDGISGFFKQPTDRPWYALSGAIFAQRHARYADRIVDRLIRLAADGDNESDRAAATLALGIANAPRAAADLRRVFDATDNLKVRGYAAVALGMLEDPVFKPRLLALAQSSDVPAALRGQAIEGLAYHGDPSVIPPLVESLEKTKSDWVRAELTRVIGEMGDQRAIASLKRIAGDSKEDVVTRQSAIGALGLLAQKDDVAWTSELKRGYNTLAETSSMGIILRIF